MPLFRAKPILIEAVQWNGSNLQEIEALCGERGCGLDGLGDILVIDADEGQMTALTGHWIVKNAKGELRTCKPDVFDATYEAV